MGSQVPVLMLTARDSIDARIAGLDSGADDYLTKPFDVGELYARLRALIRRGVRPPVPVRMTAGPLEIDTRSHSVTCRGQLVSLTKREYALLEYLVRRAGEVVGRAEISEHVWDGSYDPMSNVIDVFIQRLRRKIDRPGDDSIIQTRRGEGYLLTSDSPDHAPAR
jgi:two-component system copper resistance phosphate regulon response regulator CusR